MCNCGLYSNSFVDCAAIKCKRCDAVHIHGQHIQMAWKYAAEFRFSVLHRIELYRTNPPQHSSNDGSSSSRMHEIMPNTQRKRYIFKCCEPIYRCANIFLYPFLLSSENISFHFAILVDQPIPIGHTTAVGIDAKWYLFGNEFAHTHTHTQK